MKRLPEARLEAFEEHLLACDTCQDRLLEMEAYVNAMRSASPKVRPARRRIWGDLFRWPRPAWGAAFVITSIAVIATRIWTAPPPRGAEMVSVVLQSGRGVEGLAASTAPAGKLLSLTVDLRELPVFPSYRLEMVGSAGKLVWESQPAAKDGKIVQPMTTELPAGQYYVRLYAPNGDLLREFSLKVK